MTNSELEKVFVELETTLLNSDSRKSKIILEDLLDDKFIEVGSSGRKYDKHQTIQQLINESPSPLEATEFNLVQLSDSVVLLTYALVNRAREPEVSHSLRSSLWKLDNDKWKLVFHQGTRIEPG